MFVVPLPHHSSRLMDGPDKSLLLFLSTAMGQPACCPTIEGNEKDQQQRPRKIASQDIGEPVRTGLYPAITNQEDIQDGKGLQGKEEPVIAVLATWVICSRNRRLQKDLTSPSFLQSNVR